MAPSLRIGRHPSPPPPQLTSNKVGTKDDGTPSGEVTTRDGDLTFTPQGDAADADAVVDELALLLTNGRLNSNSKTIIKDAFESTYQSTAGRLREFHEPKLKFQQHYLTSTMIKILNSENSNL